MCELVKHPIAGQNTQLTIFQHPNFKLGKSKSSINDVALFQLSNPVTLSHTANLVCLPEMHEVDDLDGIPIITSGWGRTETLGMSPVLRSTVLQQAPVNLCEKDYESHDVPIDQKIHICGANKQNSIASVCHGDSGGKV